MTFWTTWRTRLRGVLPRFSMAFWVLMGGMLLSSAGTSMVWPFLALYVSGRLDAPLALVGWLITLQAVAGVVGTLLAGPLVDFVGRKLAMLVSLVGMAVGYVGLAYATTWNQFAVFMGLGGLFAPAFRIGGDAMVADLVPPALRERAYSILRVATNLGIAAGPAVGGWLLVKSYRWAFYAAAASLLLYGAIVLFLVRETRPEVTEDAASGGVRESFADMLRDKRLWAFLVPTLCTWMAVGMMWIYLGVHMRDGYGLAEDRYRWLVTTNALMVAGLQYFVTLFMERFSLRVSLVAGALLYTVAVGGVMWAHTFWQFWGLMVVMTLGEILVAPAASTWVANLAPPHLRGRYMAVLSFLWALGAGIVAPLGGWLNDQNVMLPWLVGAALAALGALLFALQRPPQPASSTPA